jgi:hypothetical protein
MKRITGIAGITLIIVMIISRPAHAYLDPGTGSMLIQAAIAIIAAGSLFLSMFWKRVKAFLNKIFGSKEATGDQHNDEHE